MDRRSRRTVWLLALSLWIAFFAGDFYTDRALSLAPFYVLPVALASWWAGRRAGLTLAFLSALAVLLVDQFSHPSPTRDALTLAWFNSWSYLSSYCLFALISGLTHRIHEERSQILYLSSHDELTGVLNRRSFEEAATKELERLARYGHPVTLIYLDLDHFKQVNDRQGHSEGDRVLQIVCRCFCNSLRRLDTVGRLGGDEFAILLPETSDTEAQVVTQRLLSALREDMSQHGWPVTGSLGVVSCMAGSPSLKQVVQRADALMYQVKERGRNGALYSVLDGQTDQGLQSHLPPGR
ncbi:MAG: diguanylate cyclase [Candidatus Eremiobacteraeota bacterium]|nr:diguanylate cyclase [Candidatus Eremiobacteraeota bacterium]